MKVTPLADRILADKFKKGERKTAGGIVLKDDDGKSEGIRPRWARVYAVGSDINYLEPGQWIYIEHGRWSHGVKVDDTLTVYQIDPLCVMAVTDENPNDEIIVDTP